MNKLLKVIYTLLGAVNAAFGIVIPISVALLIISTVSLGPINQWIVIFTGMLSTAYRAISVWI